MKKKFISIFLCSMICSSLIACGNTNTNNNTAEIKTEEASVEKILNETKTNNEETVSNNTDNSDKLEIDGVFIDLSDEKILVDNSLASEDSSEAVYVSNDIVFYEEGKDFTYGEGTNEDEHTKEEADKHTVINITKPGNYILKGALSAGQIAIDLGDDSKEDSSAVVNLYLNNVDISNTVAPAIIFYNVYEPFNDISEENASKDVDTSSAGANIFIVDGTENNIEGSYVSRIYDADSVVLSEDGKTVEDVKKLHKYDAAVYSKTTLNVNGDEENSGILNIKAENEGLDSEMHLTINGGIINIESGNDGINTNEDGISVTTINGGSLSIFVNGETGEGDGIDSNGWLVVNGGIVNTQACGFSMDSGIDSDKGIHINGGVVIASGNMLDRISENKQSYAVFNFNEFLGEGNYILKNMENVIIFQNYIKNSFSSLIISTADLVEGDYTLWYNDIQLTGAVSLNNQMNRPEPPKGFNPENMNQDIKNMTPPEGFNGDRPEPPEGFNPENMNQGMENMTPPENVQSDVFKAIDIEFSEIFSIKNGENYFSFIKFLD